MDRRLRSVTWVSPRDLISCSHEKGSVVAVAPSDTLLVAHGRMKLYDVSQLPVTEDGKIGGRFIGLITRVDVTNHLRRQSR